MRRSMELVTGWVITTFALAMLTVILKPLMIPLMIVWVFATLSVVVDVSRSLRHRRVAAAPRPSAIAPSPPVARIEPSGMIVLPPQDRDPQWGQARLQQSGKLHVDRDLRPLTDCPAGHYDYHELRSSSLDQAVRRCAWCPPSADTWTEGRVGSKDSER